MTDRYNFLTVVLKKDIRSDDAQALITAIGLFQGVLSVEPNVSNPNDWTAQARSKDEILNQIWDLLMPPKK